MPLSRSRLALSIARPLSHTLSHTLSPALSHPLARALAASSLRASLAMTLAAVLVASLAACTGDVLSPARPPVVDGPASDTVHTTPVPRPDSGARVTLLLELQRVDGAPLPVRVLDDSAGAPRRRAEAYAGGLRLLPDGTYSNSVALTEEIDGAPQPVRVVRDSGTYRVGVGRITLLSATAPGRVGAIELGADSTWTLAHALVDGAATARLQYGTAATRPPVLALTGDWRFLVSDLTDGAVRCRLGGFGWSLVERDGAVTGESTAQSGAGAGMDCAIVGRVPPFVTPSYGAGMPVTGRIVGDRVVLESRAEDGEGRETLLWRAEGRVVASDTRMWSHVEGTLTIRERDGAAVRTYVGRFVMRKL